jgi:two-component system OmpR family response regulator
MNSPERKKQVLIVEDDEGIRNLMTRFLEKNEFIVHSTGDGASAFRIITEHKPDVVLLDVELPDISGYEICRYIKREDRLKDVEIMFMSGWTSHQNRLVGYLAGAKRYLCKPFLMEDLLEQVTCLSRNHNTACFTTKL